MIGRTTDYRLPTTDYLADGQFSPDENSAGGAGEDAPSAWKRRDEVHARAQEANHPEGPDGLAAPWARGGVFERVFRLAVPENIVSGFDGGERFHGIFGHPG